MRMRARCRAAVRRPRLPAPEPVRASALTCAASCERQTDDELAALSRAVAARRDGAAVALDQVAHDRQSDAKPALRSVERLPFLDEQIEDARQHLRRDADPGVAHGQHDVVVDARRANGHHAVRRRVLGRVGQEIRDHLAQARRVAVDAKAVPRHVHSQRVVALLEQRAGHLDRFRDHLGHLDDLGLQLDAAAGDAGDVEQVVHQAREVVDLPLDDRAFALRSRLAAQLHQLQRRQDRRQRIAQLVSEHREELVLGPVRALRGHAQAVDLLARRHLRRHVGGDDEDPLDLPGHVAERRIDEVEVERSRTRRRRART